MTLLLDPPRTRQKDHRMSEAKKETPEAVLARIDERTKTTEEKITHIEEKLDSNYVTKDEFRPVKQLVYGFVGVVLLAVVGALVALVIIKPQQKTVYIPVDKTKIQEGQPK